AAETTARTRQRDLQHEANAARDRHTAAEREASRNAARLSALNEAKARLTANREEATAALHEATRGIESLPPGHDIEAQLATVRGEIEQHRVHLAEVRAEAQAIAREAEIAARRLNQIAGERNGWTNRKDSAASQITTLNERIEEAKTERAGLVDA